MEVDLYPLLEPELAEAIDGAIGELSTFHDTSGYYAQGVGAETATLPAAWIERVIRVRSEGTRQAVGLSLIARPRDLQACCGPRKGPELLRWRRPDGMTMGSILLWRCVACCVERYAMRSCMRGWLNSRSPQERCAN